MFFSNHMYFLLSNSEDFPFGINNYGNKSSPALRVPQADTRLTVYRPAYVYSEHSHDMSLRAGTVGPAYFLRKGNSDAVGLSARRGTRII